MELVIFVGLQASGKSTFCHTHYATTHVQVSKDRLRNNKNRARRQAQLIEAALQAGRSVVVDNTNPTVEDRRLLIHLGDRYRAKIIGYYFVSRVSCCLKRNRTRLGKARVPDVAIYTTVKKLTPPTYTEGFHKLFHVHIVDNAAFEVHPWIEAGVTIDQVN